MGPDEKWQPKPGERIEYRAGEWHLGTFTRRVGGGRWWFTRDDTGREDWNPYDGIAPLGTHTGAKPEPWVPAIGEECEGLCGVEWHRGKYRGQHSRAGVRWVAMGRHQIERDDGQGGIGDNGWWLVKELRPVGRATPGVEPGREATMHAYTWNIWALDDEGGREALVHSRTEPATYKNAHNAELVAWAEYVAGNPDSDPDDYEIDVIQVGK